MFFLSLEKQTISHFQYFGTSPKFHETSKVTWGSAVAATSSCNALRYNFPFHAKFNKTKVNNHLLLQTDNCSLLTYFCFSFTTLDEQPSPVKSFFTISPFFPFNHHCYPCSTAPMISFPNYWSSSPFD